MLEAAFTQRYKLEGHQPLGLRGGGKHTDFRIGQECQGHTERYETCLVSTIEIINKNLCQTLVWEKWDL